MPGPLTWYWNIYHPLGSRDVLFRAGARFIVAPVMNFPLKKTFWFLKKIKIFLLKRHNILDRQALWHGY